MLSAINVISAQFYKENVFKDNNTTTKLTLGKDNLQQEGIHHIQTISTNRSIDRECRLTSPRESGGKNYVTATVEKNRNLLAYRKFLLVLLALIVLVVE